MRVSNPSSIKSPRYFPFSNAKQSISQMPHKRFLIFKKSVLQGIGVNQKSQNEIYEILDRNIYIYLPFLSVRLNENLWPS